MSSFELDRRPVFGRTLICAAIVGVSLPLAAVAQDAPRGTELTPVVITASGFEQKITDAPASITVITQEDLQRNRFANLAQAIGNVEGVDVGQGTGKTGGLNISIRGMPSAYTLILIDGRRQNNGGEIGPNGFGEVLTSFMPPLSAIERIEIIRGPMSTLYGSDALGGVVNIITRKVSDTWGGTVSLDQTIQENRDFGMTSSASVYASGPLVQDSLGLAVRGRVYDRGASDLEHADGSTVSRRGAAAVEGRTFEIGTRLNYLPHTDHEIALDLERGRQYYNNDDCQLGTLDGRTGGAVAGCDATPSTNASGYADFYRVHRDQIALTHRGRFGFGVLDSSITHKSTETLGRTIPGTIGTPYTGFPTIVGGAPRELKSTDLIFDSKLVAPVGAHTLTLGAQWIDAELTDGIALDTFQRNSWSLFAENEWRIIESLALTVGARYEDHDAFGGHTSPRAYLVWNALPAWTFKGGVSRGYRVPTVNQLHGGINGATGQGATITIGTPNLKPETSTNTEVGVYYEGPAGFNANLTVFQIDFKDRISTGTPIPNCNATSQPGLPGCLDLGSGFTQDSFAQSTNIGEAETRGIEAAASWQISQDWRLSGNYTFSDSEQKSGADAGALLSNSPRHRGNASLDWRATSRLDLWLKAEYSGTRNRFTNLYGNLSAANQALVDAVGDIRAFTLLHLGGAFAVADNVKLTATIYNLLDQDFLEGASYINHQGNPAWASYYIQTAQSTTGTLLEGRRLWLSVSFEF